MNTIELWIPGIPKPGGSKKAFLHPHTKRIIVKDDCSKNGDWKNNCAFFAGQAFQGDPLTCPLSVRFEFYFPRPKGHFGSGKNAGQVKASAPPFPAVKPDCTKLIRSTEDALTGVVWKDDALIVDQSAVKRYGERPGAKVTVIQLSEGTHEQQAPNLG